MTPQTPQTALAEVLNAWMFEPETGPEAVADRLAAAGYVIVPITFVEDVAALPLTPKVAAAYRDVITEARRLRAALAVPAAEPEGEGA
jgi:hypothetical protein